MSALFSGTDDRRWRETQRQKRSSAIWCRWVDASCRRSKVLWGGTELWRSDVCSQWLASSGAQLGELKITYWPRAVMKQSSESSQNDVLTVALMKMSIIVIIIIIIIIIPGQCLWCWRHDSVIVLSSHNECRTEPDSCQPFDEADRLEPVAGYETTSTITIYYYSARKLIPLSLSLEYIDML